MPQDVISEFYKDVIEPKKYFASEEEFRGILNDTKSRNEFFNDVIKAENIFTDLSEFENTLGLKKKEDGGIPYRTPSAPVSPSFGTPSVVEASEQLESQSKLTPPRIKGVSVKSPLEGIKGAPPPTTEYGLIPEGKEKKKSLFEIEKLPSESNASIERLNQNAELQTKLLNDPSYALLSDSDEKRKKIYTEKNKAVAEQRNQTLDELYSDMDEYLADFLPENDKKEYTGLRDRVDLLKKINQAKVNGQPTENLEKQYDEMVTAFSEAKAKRISDADSQIKQLRLSLEETPVQEQQPILDEIRLLEASKKPFFTDKKQAAAQIVMQEGLQGNKSDQEKLREYAHALMRERSDLREMLGMKGARRTIGESVVDMTIGGDDAVLQRLTDVETKLKSIAPIVLINETPLVEKEGALKVLGKEFMGSLAPTTKAIIPTQQSVAQNTLQGLELAGVDLNNISKEAISTIEKTSKPYEDWSAKDFAQMSGTTFGFMPKFVIASAVTEGVGGLSAVSPYWRSIKILAERGSLGNKVNNNVLAALQANKYGRGFLKTAFSGVEFGVQSEVESRIFQADKDEVNAVTGGTGGTLGKIFGIGIEKASNITSKAFSTVMTSLFGNKSVDATNKVLNFAKTAYSKTKTVNEKAVGEVGEETGESLANLYQESENGQQFFDKVAEQYGDVSKGLKFFLSTYMMGAAFGSGTYFGRWSTNKSAKLYNDLSPKEKAVADNIISDIRQEQNKAETDAAIDAIKESDLPEDKKDELIKDANKQGEIINNVIEDKANASELEQFAPTEKEQIKEEYDRAKEPIIGRTDVTQEGLGVATETGTQGVTREGVPSEEVDAQRADIERINEVAIEKVDDNFFDINYKKITIPQEETISDYYNDKVQINEDDKYVYVRKIQLSPSARNKGYGKAIYHQLNTYAKSKGKVLHSDKVMQPDAHRVWDSLVKSGYAIKTAPKSYEFKKEITPKQPLKATEEKVSDALKDVESTARALEGVDAKEIEQKVLPNVIDIYKIQDDGAERILERSFKPNRVWVYKIENAGDIIRELSKYKNEFLDPSYIYEKVNKIEKFLKEQQNQLKVSPEDSYFQFKRQNEESVKDFISAYENLPTISEAQSVAKKMVLDLLNGNIDEAQKGIDYFNEIRKADDIKAELQKRNKYQISEAYHNAKSKPEAQRSASDNELITSVETLLKPKEYATQEIKQPKGVRTEPKGGIKGGETKTPSVSDSVQRTKESEKEREVRGEKPPTPEGSTTTLPPRIKGGSERVMVFKDGEWQERVGRETTKVSEKVKAEAQEAFAKPVSVKEKKKSDDVADSILQGLGVVEGDATMSVIESVRNALAETGIEIKVIENQDEYNKEAQKRGAGEDTEGMFVSDEGVIYINKNKIKDLWGDTIIFHEGTHPVINIIRNTNPKLFEKIVQGARELGNKYKSVADVLKFAEQYRMDVVENEDGNFDVVDKEGNIMATFDSEEKANAFVESKIADEFVTEIIARIASGKIQIEGLPKTLLQSIIDIMNKIFEALGVDTRITDTAPFAFKRKAEEIADALKSGRGISDIVGKENVKEYMNQMFSPEVILGGDIKKGAISQSRITNEPVINVYQSKEVEKLEVKTLDEIYDEYNGKAVVINSDPTRVGFLKLPSGKTIFMYGGPAYLSIKDNVDGSVGFATTQISKVNTWNKYFKQLFGNKKGVTLVATQTPLSMLSNSYALRYVMDAISTLPKSVLKSYEFKNEFFGKNLVALKNAFGEKAYNDFVKKYKNADLSNPNIIDGMISEMAYKIGDDNKPASFKARGKFVSNLLAGIDLKSKSKTIEGDVGYYSKKPNKYIAKELFERLGLNTEKLLYELGEKELIDLYIKQGKWGFAVSGFETSPKISIELVQSKGVKHPLFNAKFPSSNSFLLDGAYEINKLFKPIEMEAPKGGVYTKTAAQMLAGSMYVKGERVEKGKSFEYSKVAPSYKRVQASKGGREEIESIVEKSKADGNYLKAPNGNDTKLNEGQWATVRTKAFKNWFGDWENNPNESSQIVDDNGEPKVMYTGTSKDKDFDRFNVPKNGTWFTESAESASDYAFQNDSMNVKYNPDTGKYEDVNVASRVIPVFLNIRRPEFFNKAITKEQREKIKYADNYKKLQGLYFQDIYYRKPVGQRTDGLYYSDNKDIVVVLESPNQIKSATGNLGTFSPQNPKIQFSKGQREEITLTDGRTVETKPLDVEVVNGFYSPIEKNVKEYGKDKIKAKDWLNVVGKGDEAVFTGVRAFLEEKDPNAMVSKQEILDYMKDNRISVVEVVLKEGEGKTAKERFGRNIELEGEKENYKEVLVTLPSSQLKSINEYNDARDELDAFERSINIPTEEDRLRYSELSEKVKELQDRLPKNVYIQQGRAYIGKQPFRSTHFDEPNILVHLRMNTRMGTWEVKKGDKFIDGNGNLVVATENTTQSGKVLFLEEVQSDWGQTGKKEGFKSADKDAELKKLQEEARMTTFDFNQIEEELDRQYEEKKRDGESRSELRKRDSDFNKLAQQYIPAEQRMLEARRAFDLFQVENRSEVPTAPFVMDTNAWVKLGLKVALKEAVKQGADKIAWTTGEQQNDRYDLSKQVDEIGWQKNENGTYNITPKKDGSVVGTRDMMANLTLKQVEDYVGKDIAEKIQNDEGKVWEGGNVKQGKLTGQQLKVGGKGMKGFYGSMEEGSKGIVGGVAEKVFGQKVGETDIIQQKGDVWEDNKGNWNVTTVDAQGNENTTKFSDKRGAESYANLNKFTVSQPSIDVTPALRAEVQRGLAQFSLGGRENVINKIKDSIKNLREQGFSDSDIIEGLNKIKDQIGLTDADIKDIVKGEEKISDAKEREVQNNRALSYGYKNIYHALNSVNKETGESYEKLSDVPDSILEEVAVAKGLTEVSEDVDKIISEIDQVITGEGDSKKMAKSLIAGLKRSEKYTQDEKDRITEKVGEFYLTQSTEKLEEIGQAFIDAIGSLEEAAKEAILPTSKMLPTVRIFVLGQSILNAKKLQDRATSKAEKERLADYQNDLFDAMDEYLREFGRAIQYTSRFYMPSALAATRKEVKKIEKTNKLRNPQVNKSAKAVKDIVEDKADLKDSVNEAVEDALEGSQKTIESLQKEIDALRKQIAGGRKGSKGNPINLGVTKEQVKEARNRLLNKTYANAPLNPEFWKDMGILAADAIQEGFRKVGDFYDYMRKALNGKYSDAYGDVYLKARDKALDLGAKASEFSTDEEVESELDRIQKESDAEKITRLTAAKAKLEAKKSKKEADAAKIAANRIISDAKRELNNEATKKEKDAINKIIDVVAKKAKELSKSQNKPIGNNVADLVKFAFEQADNGRKIWNEAQKEVYSIIEKDTKLTNEEKQDLINFLDKYRDGVFDILLTKGQKDRIIKEKLIEAGYAAQKGGRVVLNLEPIIAKVRTIDDAVKAIVKSISKETGLTEAELSDFSNAIKVRLMDIVTEKKLNKINAYLKKNEPRMAAGLIGNKKRKTRVQKLLELYNAGGLSDKRVKEVLAKELGIISFTKEDEAWLENKFEEADKAPIGAELEKIEEEIQAYLEHKTEGIFGKTLFDRMQSRLLSSPLTFVKNLSGFADTLTMAIQQTVLANKGLINPKNWKDGKFDANTLKVLGKTIQMALSTSMDIAINGGVDLGTAFSESTGTKEGTPRVRYLEYTQTTVPDLYVFMGGRKINLNVYNVALKNEKLVGRSLAFADTWNQLMLQEMKTYTYIKNKLMANDPLLTDKQASQKAYDIMYAIDIEQAKAETAEEFESRGIVLDMSKRSDLYRFNRRVYEKVVQAREEAVVKAAAEFAGRYTYKVSDVGATTPVVFIINNIKKVLSMAASETRAFGKKYPESYKYFEALAGSIETFTNTLFTTTMPFVNGVANILEKGLELYPPYGIAKGLGYLTTGAFAQKISKDKNFADNLYSKSGEFFVRAIIGLAITEMLKSMADSDDDDDKPALYGAGDEDYRKGQAIKTLRPPNTIIVKGNPINLDYLGSFGVSLKAQAALLDLERYSEKYSKMDEKDRLAAKSMSAASSILLGAYSKGFYDLLKGEANLEAKGAEYLTRLVIPFTSGVRQAYQVANPKAKRPIGFAENLAKYSGLVAGWSLNRPAFDYRGREYRTGQLYTGSPDAFIGMFAEMDKLADNYDKLILGSTGYDMAFTGFAKTDPKYYVVDKETGKEREMTDEEYYDVMKKKNEEFDKLVKQELSDPSIQEDMRSSVKVAKEVIGKLNSAAKVKAFQDVFGELPIAVQEEEKVFNE